MIELLFAEMFGNFTLSMMPKWIGANQAFLTPNGQTNNTFASIMARLNIDIRNAGYHFKKLIGILKIDRSI